jgi:hypothetical protein
MGGMLSCNNLSAEIFSLKLLSHASGALLWRNETLVVTATGGNSGDSVSDK